MKIKPFRGEIWSIDLDPVIGHEQAKTRPCLVISENTFNQGPFGIVTIVPITSKYKTILWYVKIKPVGILKYDSYALCHQLRTVSINRFLGKSFGQVNQETLNAVLERLRILLGIS